jgi:small-conductance mechanosensitive channel
MDIEYNLLENELLIDTISQNHLKETAMWTKFLAITGFFLSALIAIGAFVIANMFNKLTALPGGKPIGAMAGGMITIIYLFVAAIAFFMSFFLFKFSVKMQTALKANDQETLNVSFLNLKNHYRFAGIITILYLVILLLALIGGIMAAMLGR